MTQVDNYAGEKSGFGRAEQEARGVELMRIVNEAGQRCTGTPRNHHAGKDAPCTPMLDEHRAGNLQRDVTEEENSRAQAEDAVAESQIAGHAERGVGHASAVNVIRDVENEKKRKQADGDLMARAVADFSGDRWGRDGGIHEGKTIVSGGKFGRSVTEGGDE